MTKNISRLLKCALIALAVLAALLLLFINSNLAALAEMLYTGSGVWTHAALLAVEVLVLFRFWRALFGGHRHLLLMDGDTPEARQQFSRELACRMRKNPLILEAGLTLHGQPEPEEEEKFLEQCLAHLNAKANEEIQQNARRIFLATALSQNGKLDALIMFVSVCRLIWRISAVYNQRPHPREVLSLYWAVITSTFLALSIEELDIPTEITVGFGEAFHAMAPAGLTASIPFAGKALQTFTVSVIDGAANCYLGLRAGIITRNAYAYGARQTARPSRAAVFKEAGALLLDMSHELVAGVAGTLAEGLSSAAGYAGKKTVQAGKDVVGGIGSSAGKLATGTVTAVQSTGSGLARLGRRTGAGLAHMGRQTGAGLAHVGKSAGAAVGKTASTAANLLRMPFTRKK